MGRIGDVLNALDCPTVVTLVIERLATDVDDVGAIREGAVRAFKRAASYRQARRRCSGVRHRRVRKCRSCILSTTPFFNGDRENAGFPLALQPNGAQGR